MFSFRCNMQYLFPQNMLLLLRTINVNAKQPTNSAAVFHKGFEQLKHDKFLRVSSLTVQA